MKITPLAERSSSFVRPLDYVHVATQLPGAEVVVTDAANREYVRMALEATGTAGAAGAFGAAFSAAGALGTHTVRILDEEGCELERASFSVDAQTAIEDAGGTFAELLRDLNYTMNRDGAQQMVIVDGRPYSHFVCWLRDHVHTLKGNKYFQRDLKPGVNIYLDTQCENGMIWDNLYARNQRPNYWDHIFGPEFIRPVSDGLMELKRIPVEADVEYLLVEGIYNTWKATGDTEWMRAALPKAARALHYCQTDRYRWSEKFGLVKRGYTIDTWDFQVEEDSAIYGHAMVIGPKTPFGIMHGDNTGFMAACSQMAEMHQAAGKPREAQRYLKLGRTIKQRLDEAAWNGRFYRHRVAEAPEQRDLGVDEAEQMSLSNAYGINRGMDHEQCVAVIEEYLKIRANLPAASPGEWYAIYPWFGRGFGGHASAGEYMNGGVLTIVAGELAHGAFQHGYEAYAADILKRVLGLARRHAGYLHCSFKGFRREPPTRTFRTLDLRAVANVDFHGETPGRGWTMERPENDLRNMPVGRQTFCGVPFDVIDPAHNDRRACLALSRRGEPFVERALVDADGARAGSVYFLHASSQTGAVAGEYVVRYTDGTTEAVYLRNGNEITGWWMPEDTRQARLAWWGPNAAFNNVGLVAYGWNNPHPDKPIEAIELNASRERGVLLVAAVTLSDAEVWFEPSDVSFGIPDNWGAAAVVYALVEGLAGVVDRGVAFGTAAVEPRWPAAGADEAAVTIVYAESRGYVAYRYSHEPAQRTIRLELTGSGEAFPCHVLLPAGAQAAALVTCNGEQVEFATARVEGSSYADFELRGPGPFTVTVIYG